VTALTQPAPLWFCRMMMRIRRCEESFVAPIIAREIHCPILFTNA